MKCRKEAFLEKSLDTLSSICDIIDNLPRLKVDGFIPEKTVLVIVDMINAFAREGNLMSPRVNELVSTVSGILKLCRKHGIGAIAFADCHAPESPEFDAYPKHALAGTSESEVVDEIKEIGGYTLILKNSTNGFLEEGFQSWLRENPQVENFIVVGDCTDICVQQFATTLKADFNRRNRRVRVIVPVNAVDTYDYEPHNGDLMHLMALFSMMGNGIELCKGLVE
ncbi:amidases related to nicotinamidase [Pelotomaculum thermopropionicum SI]|uniref:Amidases related to nicotinamidase n=1 Tax=Pelotomaculum thermopropionicum (strain DSM 13744 / JCM 10971 / SI) TaxID=370438 RepID=A5D1R5_PELTS|nr:amidases related to nicotinamidase [Pelotomaculum thermopropionicum SI]